MKFRTFLTALTAVFAISVAQTATAGSCGGGDHSHGDGYTVVDKAAADGNFSTLIAAVEAAGLQEVLSGHGPFTVFAPTDAAQPQIGSIMGRMAPMMTSMPEVTAGEVVWEL